MANGSQSPEERSPPAAPNRTDGVMRAGRMAELLNDDLPDQETNSLIGGANAPMTIKHTYVVLGIGALPPTPGQKRPDTRKGRPNR